MRKVIIAPVRYDKVLPTEIWLNLDELATVHVTSEQPSYPIESAFTPDGVGWRAASNGTQTIRLVFDEPQKITRIWLMFEETENARTQEFVLRWSPDRGQTFHEIVRQQWNFGSDSARETENYNVELSGVTVLELIIMPDNRGGQAKASLMGMRLA
jgi:F5/8 type C domain